MNETLKVISSRRSIRSYKADQIADSELQQIMDAAILAPSAMNLQKWHFTVVQNKAVLDKIAKELIELLKKSGNEFFIKRASDPNYSPFYNAPTIVFIFGDEKSGHVQYDCAAAAQNILLAAESLGIGSCYMASSNYLFASEYSSELKKELGVPEGFNPICSIALGYKTAENPPAPPRNRDVINYVK